MNLQEAITYTGISQAVIAYLSLFGWYEIMRSINSGQIGSDLLKPMNYFIFWMAQDLGRALVNLFVRGLLIMLFYALIFDITYPTQPGQWLALLLSLALAWMVSFAWRFLTNLAAFWSPNAIGIGRMAFTLSYFLSGFLMPLRFMPEWFTRVPDTFPDGQYSYRDYLGLHTPAEIFAAPDPALVLALMSLGLWLPRLSARHPGRHCLNSLPYYRWSVVRGRCSTACLFFSTSVRLPASRHRVLSSGFDLAEIRRHRRLSPYEIALLYGMVEPSSHGYD
jgi:ABC-2 type transport system permease protein